MSRMKSLDYKTGERYIELGAALGTHLLLSLLDIYESQDSRFHDVDVRKIRVLLSKPCDQVRERRDWIFHAHI